ncbi:MAG: hypothetical protein HYZ81_18440 [Nitrospinae bacterium]|nr:hypothetical protein [Nitrospinota bacterium]
MGGEVEARADLLKVVGRMLRFKGNASHEDHEIGEEAHMRAIVCVSRFDRGEIS